MLENDLVLTRFLDARGERMTDDEAEALGQLLDLADGELWLDLADGELWDVLSGRAEPGDATLRPLVAELRAA